MTHMLLRSKSKNKERTRHVSVYLPRRVYTYITVFALSKEKSKTLVLCELVENWLKTQSGPDLIQALVDRLKADWMIRKKMDKVDQNAYVEYRENVRQELLDKGVEEDCVKIIIKGMDNGKD